MNKLKYLHKMYRSAYLYVILKVIKYQKLENSATLQNKEVLEICFENKSIIDIKFLNGCRSTVVEAVQEEEV